MSWLFGLIKRMSFKSCWRSILASASKVICDLATSLIRARVVRAYSASSQGSCLCCLDIRSSILLYPTRLVLLTYLIPSFTEFEFHYLAWFLEDCWAGGKLKRLARIAVIGLPMSCRVDIDTLPVSSWASTMLGYLSRLFIFLLLGESSEIWWSPWAPF